MATNFSHLTRYEYFSELFDELTREERIILVNMYFSEFDFDNYIHEFTEDAPVFDPETNTHSRYCTSCDMDVAESCTFIPAITTDASVTEAGVTTRTCSVCGGSYETYFYLRLMGSNRYETAFLAADQLKIELGVEEFENIIVASGTGAELLNNEAVKKAYLGG